MNSSEIFFLYPEWVSAYSKFGNIPLKRYVKIPRNSEFIWLGDREGATAIPANYVLFRVTVAEAKPIAKIRTHKNALIIDTWLKDHTNEYVA